MACAQFSFDLDMAGNVGQGFVAYPLAGYKGAIGAYSTNYLQCCRVSPVGLLIPLPEVTCMFFFAMSWFRGLGGPLCCQKDIITEAEFKTCRLLIALLRHVSYCGLAGHGTVQDALLVTLSLCIRLRGQGGNLEKMSNNLVRTSLLCPLQ